MNIIKSLVLENFKHSNHKIKTQSTNMLFSKTILLIGVRLPSKTVYKLKINNIYLQNKIILYSLRKQFLFC